jgi:NitT/TauT family transport system substrate-binding protein
MGFTSTTIRGIRAALLATSLAATLLTPAQAEEVTTLKINRSPVGTFQGLFIAQEPGYFAERGIELDIHVGSSPDGALAELMSGTADLAMTGAVPLVAGVANGLPVVATLNTQEQGTIPTMGLLALADGEIKSIEDLRGKKIGLPGISSPQGLALLLELEKFGMTADDVELVNLPFPGVLSAIESGAVDAGIPIGLFYTLGVQGGMKVFPEVFANLRRSPAVLFAANKMWAAENADVIAKFNEAMLLAYEYGNANPEIIRRIDAEYTRMPPAFIETREIAPFVGAFGVSEWELQNEDLLKFGFVPRVPEASEYIWSGAPTN